jgi:integrase/recombinase XerD
MDIYRRHSPKCPHRSKGGGYTKCSCPIWLYGGVGPSGKPIQRSLKLRDWSRALRQLEEQTTTPIKTSAPTLFLAVESYIVDCRRRALAESTILSYGNTLERLLDYCGAGFRLDRLDLAKLSDFQSHRRVRPSTTAKELETLRAFCHFCRKRKWIEQNPAADLDPPKEQGPPTLPFERGEIDKILAACGRLEDDNPSTVERTRARARARILVLLYTGFRISDVERLSRKSVDLTGGRILVRIMKTGVEQYIRLHPTAVEALRALPEEGPYFFWSGESKLATAIGNARKSIQRVLKNAGVAGHPHRFRDTFSVSLLEAGEDLRTVQLLLGHQSIRTTEKHYAPFVRSFQKRLDEATAKLDFGPQDQLSEVQPLKKSKRLVRTEKSA